MSRLEEQLTSISAVKAGIEENLQRSESLRQFILKKAFSGQLVPWGYDLFTQRLPLTERLEALLQRRVEVIPEHELSRHLRKEILKKAAAL